MIDDLTEDQRRVLDTMSWGDFAQALNHIVTERDHEWCGVPMPLPGLSLVVEPRNPHTEMIRDMQEAMDEDRPNELLSIHGHPLYLYGRHAEEALADPVGWPMVNAWYGRSPRGVTGDIAILRHADGRMVYGVASDLQRRNERLFHIFDVMAAWNIETELTAMRRLSTLVQPHLFKAYLMGGVLLERSSRSDLWYLFRRGRPTLVCSFHGRSAIAIIAGLCLHPIGYYENSMYGAMTPTDDVIAHLLLMRGDEPLFWRRANQHPAIAVECGI